MTDPKKLVQLSLTAVETSIAASLTVAARWPILLQTIHAPSRASIAETRLMFSEKVAAVFEGSVAAQLATISFAGQIARGEVRNPGDVIRATTDALEAALKPARQRIVNNAKRLSRP